MGNRVIRTKPKKYQVDEYYLEIQKKAQYLDIIDKSSTQKKPFPGLRPFKTSEAHLFFGREGLSNDLLRILLKKSNFLAILGASGSGKSSLVRAGLIPNLHAGKLQRENIHWRIVICRPGNNPLGNLAAAFACSRVKVAQNKKDDFKLLTDRIYETLTSSSYGILDVLETFDDIYERTLIIIDQFEELFRFYSGKPESKEANKKFVNLLLTASSLEGSSVYTVITMRSEFLGECVKFRNLPEAINQGQYLIPRLTPRNIEDAIEGPISVVGKTISRGLVNRMIYEVGDNMDQLPVLQHALMRTYNLAMDRPKDKQKLSVGDYEVIGTMTKALSIHATTIFDGLNDEAKNIDGLSKKQRIAKLIFQRLTDQTEGLKGGRYPTPLYKLHSIASEKPLEATKEEVNEVINAFRGEETSFLMPPGDTPLNDELVIDISHESLMRNWDLLIGSDTKKGWIQEEIENGKRYLQLQERRIQNDPITSNLLDDLLIWKQNNCIGPVWAKRYHHWDDDIEFEKNIDFLRESEEHRKEERQKLIRERRLKKRLRQGISLLGIIILILGWFLMLRASQAETRAENQRILSIFETLKRSNPTLSYHAVVRWFEITDRKPTGTFKEFIDAFDTNYSYLVGILPINASLEAIEISGGDSITVEEANTRSVWDLSEGLLLSKRQLAAETIENAPSNSKVLRKLKIASFEYHVISSQNSLELRDQNGKVILQFNVEGKYHQKYADEIKFTSDGNYFFMVSGIFDAQTGQRKARIYYRESRRDSLAGVALGTYSFLYDVSAISFLNDQKHMAIAFTSGAVKVINFADENSNGDGTLAAAFMNEDLQPITGMVTDTSNQFIITSNENNTIAVWKFDPVQKTDTLDAQIQNRFKGNPVHMLTGHTGAINCMQVSPHSNRLLTGAEDRIAMLWDVKDGSRVSILRGNDFPIKYVAFSKNDQFMFTSDKTSNVAIWRNQKPSEINSLMKLSPFELYQRGVNSSDITAGSVYKIDTANTETTSLSGVTLHYLLSLPQKNLFPEDENFSRGIKRSVREIDELFHTLLQKTDYKAVVSTPLQELLFDEYIGLQLRKYDLINDKERDTIDKKDRYAMLHRYAVNYYLKDTTNRRASLLYAHELSKMNSSFTAIDSQQIADNTSAIQNTLTVVQPVSASDSASLRKLSQDLYNYHSLKSNFKDAYYASTAVLKYKDMDAGFWYNRSWYALFAGENEEAIEAAKKTLELDKNRDGVHTNLALGYVLNDQWEKAEEVYLNWKSKVFKDHNRPANTMFLEDIAALEKAGISHHDFIKVKELFK